MVGFDNHSRDKGRNYSPKSRLMDSRCRTEAETFLQSGVHWLLAKLSERFEPELETLLGTDSR